MPAVRLLLLGLALVVFAPAPHGARDEVDGDASDGLIMTAPNDAVEATFRARSYAPGAAATLLLHGDAPLLRVAFFRAGAGDDGQLQGAQVGAETVLSGARGSATLRLGDWPSGFYYARVTTPNRGAWYAPFVMRPSHLGTERVLVVLPTNTWQAYNFQAGGSWYFDASVRRVELRRPYLDGGIPPHYHGYDRGFIRWLFLHDKAVDFLADDDLDVLSGDALARAYDLVIFSGHEEYTTQHAFDAVRRYRDRGGNLAFLSANNLFWRIVHHGTSIQRAKRFRDVGEPEAAVVGAQYKDWNHSRYPNRPFVVTAADSWIFRGTGLQNGDTFGIFGIEIDERTGSSPRGTQLLARIPDIFGHGLSAEMTYYTTARGAKVFDAGVLNFGGSALWPLSSTMLENLWAELTQP